MVFEYINIINQFLMGNLLYFSRKWITSKAMQCDTEKLTTDKLLFGLYDNLKII